MPSEHSPKAHHFDSEMEHVLERLSFPVPATELDTVKYHLLSKYGGFLHRYLGIQPRSIETASEDSIRELMILLRTEHAELLESYYRHVARS